MESRGVMDGLSAAVRGPDVSGPSGVAVRATPALPPGTVRCSRAQDARVEGGEGRRARTVAGDRSYLGGREA